MEGPMSGPSEPSCEQSSGSVTADLDTKISRTLILLRQTLATMRDHAAHGLSDIELSALSAVELSLDLAKSAVCMHMRSGANLPSATLGLAYLMEDETLLGDLCDSARAGRCPLIARR